jgi:disulfide oxidoreductase YuzD
LNLKGEVSAISSKKNYPWLRAAKTNKYHNIKSHTIHAIFMYKENISNARRNARGIN